MGGKSRFIANVLGEKRKHTLKIRWSYGVMDLTLRPGLAMKDVQAHIVTLIGLDYSANRIRFYRSGPEETPHLVVSCPAGHTLEQCPVTPELILQAPRCNSCLCLLEAAAPACLK